MPETGVPKTGYRLQRELLILLLIMTAVFAVYSKALSYGFLTSWDDPAYIVNNSVAHGFSPGNISLAFTRFFVGNYAPLHIVSYMVDYTLWGLNPRGYILSNILIHAVNGYLLTVLLRRLAVALYPAILAALLFLLHPLQVESVVWISQRKNVLAMFFFLLTVYFYDSYRRNSDSFGRKQYLLAILFFVAALLTKSVAVVLPPTLLLYDLCFSRRRFLQSIPDKIPFIIFAGLIGFVAMLSQSTAYGGGGRVAFHGGSAWATLLTMLPVAVSYLRMTVAPFDLSIVYAPLIRNRIDSEVVFAVLVLAVFLVAGCWLFKRSRAAFFWYAFIPLALIPVLQIVPLVTLMNDRYLYFPLLGVAACFGLFSQYLPEKAAARWRGLLGVAFFIMVTSYGVGSFQRIQVWKDSLSLWGDAAQKQPGSAVAWFVLGEACAKSGDSLKAIKYLENAKAVCRGVECYHALEKLAVIQFRTGHSAEADKGADEMIRLFPENAKGHVLKGYISYQQGELAAAEQMFAAAIRLDPTQTSALNALGNIYLATGRPALAIEKLKAARIAGDSSPEIYYSLACASSLLQQRQDALNYLDQALRLGYNKVDQIMKSSELSNLKEEPGFITLLQRYFPGTDSHGSQRSLKK